MAKAFKFSLQKVLDVRKHREDQLAIELSKFKAALNMETFKLMQLQDDKEGALQMKDSSDRENLNLNNLIISQSYLEQLNHSIIKQREEIKKKNKQVLSGRQELTEAMKKKKAVEILKERKQEEYKKEIRLIENKIIDEVAVRNTSRKSMEIL
jgi:flagellar FliJ protein